MQFLDSEPSPVSGVSVGLAYGPIVPEFLRRRRDLLDYVEVPFEQLRHSPATAQIQDDIPVILHCSSMSIGGFVPPSEETLEAIDRHATRTRTPWIGEHLAFISAEPVEGLESDLDPVELTYTVSPQLSAETVERVGVNLARMRERFQVPIILENSPQYFDMPGSTMRMPEFVAAVSRQCDVDLLLDITHFLIATSNMKLDPLESLDTLPVERVVEVHLSGMSKQSGSWWDDHSAPVPEAAFDVLAQVSERVQPRAVTFEYNWAPSIPDSLLVSQISRVRELFAA
jgi:uncharacterized protein (UPF0276 family)